MKLFRFGSGGHEKPGVLLSDGRSIDVSAFAEDYDEKFFGTDGPRRLQSWVAQNAHQCRILDPAVRLGPYAARPFKIICVGLNYARHAAESGLDIPKEPVIFLKATSSLCGPNDDVIIPEARERQTGKLNWPWSSENVLHV